MTRDRVKARELKEKGNYCFKHGDYETAIGFYTQALTADLGDHLLYSNRAQARLKLGQHAAVIADCTTALKIRPDFIKPHFHLAQSRLARQEPEQALSSAKRAYELSLAQNELSSLARIGETLLQAKKEVWRAREQQRTGTQNALLQDVRGRYTSGKDKELVRLRRLAHLGQMSASEAVEAANAVEVEHERRMTELQRVFAAADPKGMKLREVPDYLVDKISFGIMHDPVMTRSGHSYERATIVEYLRRADVDPLTREPLSVRDLRPNLQLRDACEAFLEENGWAVDY